MKLKINFDFHPSKKPIELEDNIMLFGSCFTNNIGEKLLENKFNVSINPLGISFNPLSLHEQINRIAQQKFIDISELTERFGVFYHWNFHSDFCEPNRTRMIENINSKIISSHEFLKKTNHVIISYGTSYFYELVNNKKIVNNCHQFPNNYFTKQIGNSNLFKDSFLNLQKMLLKINPELVITLTLSPIKHYRDGVIENNLSKSILTCFIHDSMSKTKNVGYFPSYEIINDELRDYRFYKDNFTHPSDLAIEVIWEKFKEKNIGERGKDFITNFETIKKLKTHKIKHPGNELHKQFILKGIEELNSLSQKYPTINFASEYDYFNSI
ncbi:MAG: GSCFA domain-containing protein [Bacteroidota bacterium]